MIIYEPKLFKIIFEYKIKNIDDIVILSNTNILLYKKGKDYFSILNLSKKKKKIKIELKEEMLEGWEDRTSFVKLNNNHILFYYKNSNTEFSRDYYTFSCYTFIFYFYDSKNSDLILDYKDIQTLEIESENFLPYGDYSFFFFGKVVCSPDSIKNDEGYFVYLYRNKKIETAYYKRITYSFMESHKSADFNCFIFLDKHLIVQFESNFNIYQITEKGSELISKYFLDIYNTSEYQ